MSRKRIVAAAALLAGAMALTACGGSSSSSGSSGGSSGGGGGQTLKIGFMGDLTGENSGIVIPPYQGAQLAVDEYNATNPPTKIELVKYDSQAKSDQAVALATKAAQQDKVVGMIGPAFSGESKAADAILEQGEVPNVTPSATNPGLSTNGWKYFHRLVATDDPQGKGIAGFLTRIKTPKKAFVISDDQEYSVGIADFAAQGFTSAGVPVERDKFAQGASDYSSTVSKVKAANPDVIFYGGYYAQAGRLLKQLRDGGVTATFATGDGSLDAGLISGAGQQAAEGAIVGCPCNIPFGSTDPTLKKFSDDYKAKFNADPAIYSTEGYDAATAFVKAIQAGKTDGPSINDFFTTLSFNGVSKPVKWTATGELDTTTIYVYEVKGGKISLLGPTDKAQLS